MRRVVVTGSRVPEKDLDVMRQRGLKVVNPTQHVTGDALVDALRGAWGYLLGGDEMATADVLSKCPELRLVAFLGTGFGSFVDIDAATQHGIAVTNTPRANTTSVAELTVAHILDARRRVTELNNLTKQGLFPQTMTRDLSGSTVGVIGMGAIGSAVSRMLVNGFGVKLMYHSRKQKPLVEDELGATRVELDEVLAASEVVVLAAATTRETTGLIGTDELARMRPDAILVNTARPILVDGHALFRALSADLIAAAAFDGYYDEPIPSPGADRYGLLSLPDGKFTLTPHSGALTETANDRMCAMAVASVVSFSATGDDGFVVNPTFRNAAPVARRLPDRAYRTLRTADGRPAETPGSADDHATTYREASYTFIWGTEKHSLLLLEPKLLRCVRGDRYAPYEIDYLVTSEGGRTRAYSTPGMQSALLDYGQRYLDPDFVAALQADYGAFAAAFRDFLVGLSATDWTRSSDVELDEFHEEYFWYLVDTYTFFALTFGWKLEATSRALRQAVEASAAVSSDSVDHVIDVLSSPAGLNEVTRERVAWLRLLSRHAQADRVDPGAVLAHVREFPWLAFNTYDEADILAFFRSKFDRYRASGVDPQHDVARLLHSVAAVDDERQRILDRLGDEQIDYLSGVMRWASEERLALKWFWAGGEHLAGEPLKQIAARIGVSFHDFIQSYKRADIAAFLRGGTRVSADEVARRLERVSYLVTKGRLYFYSGAEAARLEACLVDKAGDRTALLRGSTAYPGRVTGPVKIIKVDDLRALQRDFDRFERGDVLVTTMTQPNILMLLELASAVLTDEGGITSHAAVLCRELQVPCVIGLHTATTDLAEGDIVDVDATAGTVATLDRALREPVLGSPEPVTRGARRRPGVDRRRAVARPEPVLRLEEVGRSDVASVGGKAANLGELSGRFAVPRGFCVTTTAYREFLGESDLTARIQRILQPNRLGDGQALEAVAEEARAAILAAPLPRAVSEPIKAAYAELGSGRVAVRSSATAEDSDTASFAGQFDSILDVSGATRVLAAISSCWSSAYTARAIRYRSQMQIDDVTTTMAVLVQEMVNADYAGVIFTVHPVRQRDILIEIVEGLGEALVSGRRTPNRYVLADDRRILERFETFDLGDHVIQDVARVGQEIAAFLGTPADIEFALDGDDVRVLQARPITAGA